MKRDREAELLQGGEGIHEANRARSKSLGERDGSAGCAVKGFGSRARRNHGDQQHPTGSRNSTETHKDTLVSQSKLQNGTRQGSGLLQPTLAGTKDKVTLLDVSSLKACRNLRGQRPLSGLHQHPQGHEV